MSTIGVDPGHQGGAVLLGDAGRPVAAWAWHPLRRKSGRAYRLVEADGPTQEAATIAGVGALLDAAVGEITMGDVLHLAVEGLYVHPKIPGMVPTALEIAKTVGWLTAGLLQRTVDLVEVKAAVWRPAVLGCSAFAKSEEAERLALMRWRTMWSGDLVDNPHCAEAAAIGAWAMAQRRLEVAR